MKWWSSALPVCALVACGQDVRLGTVIVDGPTIPDAPPDGLGNPFTAGMYSVGFLDPAIAQCSGALSGNEADFMSITRASVNLVDGDVTFATPDQSSLVITGTPITTGFTESTLDLSFANASPLLWADQFMTDFGPGPDGTLREVMALAVEVDTAQAPGGIQSSVSIIYELAGDMCSVTFGALFMKL